MNSRKFAEEGETIILISQDAKKKNLRNEKAIEVINTHLSEGAEA